jgi:hypothetical protein
MRHLNKKLYKDELERQLYIKRQQELDAAHERKADTNSLMRQAKAVHEFDYKQKQDTRLLQQKLAQEYQSQTAYKAQVMEQERADWLASERERLQKIEEERRHEVERQRAMKELTVQSEKEALARKLREQVHVVKSQEALKLKDQEQVRANIESMLRKEQEWKARQAEIQLRAEGRTQAYETVRKAQEDRRMAELEREQGWSDSTYKRSEEMAAARQREKQASIQSTYDIVTKQIEDKESKQAQLLREKEQERIEAKRLLEELRLEELHRRLLTQKERDQLSKTLSAQVLVQKERAAEPFRMSDKEKLFNLNFINRDSSNPSPTFAAIPGTNVTDLPLKKVLPLAFKNFNQPEPVSARLPIELEGAARNFYGVSETPQPGYKKYSQYIDPNKHDPIANPIGSQTTRSSDQRSFFRGRGLAALTCLRQP